VKCRLKDIGMLKCHISRRHGGSSLPHNNGMIQYDRIQYGRRHHIPPTSYIHNPVSGQESYEKFDLFMDRIIKRWSRLVEFKNLCDQLHNPNQQSTVPSPHYSMPTQNFSSVMAQDNNNHLQSSSSGNDIFGFMGHVCKQCLGIYIHYRYFLNEEFEEVRRNKGNHVCDPNKIAQTRCDIYKDIHFDENYCRLLPSYLKQTVNEWTKGENYLIAIELSNPPGNIIKLKHPKNPAKSITLHYSQGNYIELTNIEENNWASRAIKNTQTNLSDDDLTEFLYKAKNKTFAVFKVHNQNSAYFYLMAITNVPVSNSQDYSQSTIDSQPGYLQ
jgi:hypothetical protein